MSIHWKSYCSIIIAAFASLLLCLIALVYQFDWGWSSRKFQTGPPLPLSALVDTNMASSTFTISYPDVHSSGETKFTVTMADGSAKSHMIRNLLSTMSIRRYENLKKTVVMSNIPRPMAIEVAWDDTTIYVRRQPTMYIKYRDRIDQYYLQDARGNWEKLMEIIQGHE